MPSPAASAKLRRRSPSKKQTGAGSRREQEGVGGSRRELQGVRSKTGKEQDGPMIRREQGAEGSIIKMERLLSLCIIRFLSYYVLSVWGPRAGIMMFLYRKSLFLGGVGGLGEAY